MTGSSSRYQMLTMPRRRTCHRVCANQWAGIVKTIIAPLMVRRQMETEEVPAHPWCTTNPPALS